MTEFLLSAQQRRIWLLQENLGKILITKCCLRIDGVLDREAVSAALGALYRSQDVLRTAFAVREELEFPIQVVADGDAGAPAYTYFDREQVWSDEWLMDLYEEDKEFREFFSGAGPGIRYYLVKETSGRHYLIIKALSLLLDGYSMRQVAERIIGAGGIAGNGGVAGADGIAGNGSVAGDGEISYMQFAEWQQRNLEDDVAYWKDARFQLSGGLRLGNEGLWDEEKGDVFFVLPAASMDGLENCLCQQQVTPAQFFYTCWNILLSRLSGSREFVSGYADYNKDDEELRPVLGAMAKILPVPVSLGEGDTFGTVAAALKKEFAAMAEWKDYYLLENSRGEGGKGGESRKESEPAFIPYLFGFAGLLPDGGGGGRISGQLMRSQSGFEKYKAFLTVVPENGGYRIQLEFGGGYFGHQEAKRMLGYFRKLIGEALQSPEASISELEILDDGERHLILEVFNRHELDIPGTSFIELFESQVKRNGDLTAVVAGDGALTYRELNEAANQLAHFIRDRWMGGPGDVVAILTDRSVNLIKAIMGVVKAGAAYLPLDASWPAGRIAELLNESKCRMVVTQDGLIYRLPRGIELITINDGLISTSDKNDPAIVAGGKDMAYVIYTSGSTGKPKGVTIDHEAVINLCYGLKRELHFPEEPGTRFSLFASAAFDASVQQIFSCLLGGHVLYIMNEDVRKDIGQLTRFLRENRIVVFDCTPAILSLLLEEAADEFRNTEVKKVLVGGDAWTEKLRGLFNKGGFDRSGITFYNLYGPTECGVDSTVYRLRAGDGGSDIPIGAPLPNKHIYILDQLGKPVPTGISGEIFIGGRGLSGGYLNRDDLSGELFVTLALNGERVYRSGDLGKWLPDGNIVFMGRRDDQLKIRGFRVEPAEIATSLAGHPGIREAVVFMAEQEEGQKSLIAAIVPDKQWANDRKLDEKALLALVREYVSAQLPSYMHPAGYVVIKKIPLNSSGKADRDALKRLVEGTKVVKLTTARPENEMEVLLLKVWKEVLGRADIGVDDDFFMIGGDSIKAIQISSRLHKAGFKVTIRDILNHSVLTELAPFVKKVKKVISQDEVRGVLPLVPAQCAFFAQGRRFPHHFNLPMMFYSAERIELNSIRMIFSKLWGHHDALRMVYSQQNGQWRQENRGTDLLPDFSEYEFGGYSSISDVVQREMEALQGSIDLENGPLLKVGLFHTAVGDRLLVVIHHLVIDGVSWRFLFEDIETLLRQHQAGIDLKLPDKTHSFKEWAENLAKYANSDELLQESDYWTGIENEPVDYLETESGKDDNKISDAAYVSYWLSDHDTNLLLTTANKVLNSKINDILLGALSISLREAWGLSRVAITMEGHGREGILEGMEINRTVGWFTSLYPVVLDAGHEKDLPEQIKEMKRQLNAIPKNGVGYGILKYLTDKKKLPGFEFRIKPEISFNYLGQFDEDIRELTMETSEEPVGSSYNADDNREHLLDIIAKVPGKALNFQLCYNRRHFSEEKMHEFGKLYQATLHRIAEHCAASEVGSLSLI